MNIQNPRSSKIPDLGSWRSRISDLFGILAHVCLAEFCLPMPGRVMSVLAFSEHVSERLLEQGPIPARYDCTVIQTYFHIREVGVDVSDDLCDFFLIGSKMLYMVK